MNIEPLSLDELKTIEGGNGPGIDPTGGSSTGTGDNGPGMDPTGSH
jgi:hypothetical protein